jgi:hypothetical protein
MPPRNASSHELFDLGPMVYLMPLPALRASRKGFVTGRFLAHECSVLNRRKVCSFHPAWRPTASVRELTARRDALAQPEEFAGSGRLGNVDDRPALGETRDPP